MIPLLADHVTLIQNIDIFHVSPQKHVVGTSISHLMSNVGFLPPEFFMNPEKWKKKKKKTLVYEAKLRVQEWDTKFTHSFKNQWEPWQGSH